MANRSVLYGVLALILVVLFAVTQFRRQPDARTPGGVDDILELASREDLNVIFILIDTLRADHLGVYGYERQTSPMMDHLANTGIRFARHHAQSSWTKTSMAAIWTGMYPHRTGILRYNHALPESALMPAEILREEGFTTAGVWRNGWVSPTFGFQQGFDLYHRPAVGRVIGFNRRESENPYEKLQGSDIDITDSGLEFLRANGQDRFFLYLHYMDAHQYMSDSESAIFGTSYLDLYDNSIHWTDRQVARVVDFLDQTGLRDETILVITSDHGEAFGEHGREGHAKDLHREVTHVPWIISFPFSLESGLVVESLSESVDVFPTLFDLLGQPELPYADGRSRLPEILGAAGRSDMAERSPDESPLFVELDRSWGKAEKASDPIIALILPDRRFIRMLEPEQGGVPITDPDIPRARLYETDVDPMEANDLMENGGPIDTSDLEEMIEQIWQRPGPPWLEDVKKIELSEMQKGQLKAIGYAID